MRILPLIRVRVARAVLDAPLGQIRPATTLHQLPQLRPPPAAAAHKSGPSAGACTRGAACGAHSARGSDGIGGSCVPAHRLTSLRRGTTPQLVSRHAKSRRGTEPLPDRASSRGRAQAWCNRSRGGGGAQLTRSCNIFWWRQRRLAPQLLRGNRGDRAIFSENIHWVIGIR